MSLAERAPRDGHLVGIQYLRGIAASMVAVHHALEESFGATNPHWRAPDWLTTFGAAGVDIFFVISGLVMLRASFPSDGRVERPGAFLGKRALRIYPLYWLCLLGLFFCWAAGFYRTLDPEPAFMLRNALLWPGERLALGVSWTLSYEFYFYLLFAVMLLARSRTVAVLGTCAALAVGLLAAPFLPFSPVVRLIGNPIVLEFAMGLGIAWWLTGRQTPRWGPWLAVLGFAILLASPLLVDHATTNELPMPGRLLVWGGAGALVVFAFASLDRAPARLHRPLLLLGDASYAIYLTHPFVMLAYAFVLRNWPAVAAMPQPLFVLGVVLACLGLGVLVHTRIEKPLMKRLRPTRKAAERAAPSRTLPAGGYERPA